MQTKDPKTLVTYRITLDSFEGYLRDNKKTITPETAEDIVQDLQMLSWQMPVMKLQMKKRNL